MSEREGVRLVSLGVALGAEPGKEAHCGRCLGTERKWTF